MSATRRYRLGGLVVEVSGEARALEALWRAWAAFEVEAAPEASVALEVDPATPPARAPAMPEVIAGPEGGVRLESASYRAEVDRARSAVRVRGADERFGVESALKWLLAARLAEAGGLLVHGVAVALGGRAALFTGPSGAGKSTLGKHAREAGLAVLADELVAVWPAGGQGQGQEQGPGQGGFRAEGTPWNVGAPEGAALAVVGTLAWGERPRLEPAPPAEVIRVLAGNMLLPDPGAAGRTAAFQRAARLVNAVDTRQLWFAPDAGVGAALRPVLE